mgnify:CR=1 FL=1
MRIATFSDTHGNKNAMREVVRTFAPIDRILHLGDGVRDGLLVANETGVPFQGVQGNEDYGADFPGKLLIDLVGWRFLLAHGHHMNINPYHPAAVWQQDLREMADWAKGQAVDVLLFGHAHKPVLQKENGVILCNPGDQYIGATTGASFALVALEDASARFQIFRENRGGGWDLLLELRSSRV